MDLIKPGIGLIFWTVIIFSILLFVLKKFAWNPINNAVKNREESIRSALKAADNAKEEMEQLRKENERNLLKARQEQDKIMKEGREVKDKIIAEAKEKAEQEAKKTIEIARQSIENEKKSALNEIKNQIAVFSVEIAEKILREKLQDQKEGKKLVDKLLDDIKLN